LELFNRSVRKVRRCEAIGEYAFVPKVTLHDDADFVRAARVEEACKRTQKGLTAFMMVVQIRVRDDDDDGDGDRGVLGKMVVEELKV
jgi:hypothetical protein